LRPSTSTINGKEYYPKNEMEEEKINNPDGDVKQFCRAEANSKRACVLRYF